MRLSLERIVLSTGPSSRPRYPDIDIVVATWRCPILKIFPRCRDRLGMPARLQVSNLAACRSHLPLFKLQTPAATVTLRRSSIGRSALSVSVPPLPSGCSRVKDLGCPLASAWRARGGAWRWGEFARGELPMQGCIQVIFPPLFRPRLSLSLLHSTLTVV